MTDETGVLFEEGYVEDFTKSKANDKSSRNVLFFTPCIKPPLDQHLRQINMTTFCI